MSIDNFCSLLSDYEVYIVTRDHDNGNSRRYEGINNGWNDKGNCKVLYLSDSEYKYKAFNDISVEINPDVIYLQGLFQSCIIPTLFVAKKRKIRVVLAVRGELCEGAFKKKWKKIPYICFMRVFNLFSSVDFQSTSDEESKAIIRWLHVEKRKVHLLPNIPTIRNVSILDEGIKKSGSAKFVFISRIVSKKNLLFALERLANIRGQIVFDIYGVKEDASYWAQCEKYIKSLDNNVEVNYCGVIDHDDVINTFARYDAFIFPTLSENYGHVIAESLVAGCPVIVSKETPWRELRKCQAGWDIDLEDKKGFEDAIQYIVDIENQTMIEWRNNTKEYIRAQLKLDELEQDYKKVFENKIVSRRSVS